MSETRGIKFVVIAESVNAETQISEMIQCLGIYDSSESAYGKALMYISEIADDMDGETTLTPLICLEGETGFGLYLKNQAEQVIHDALVLFYRVEEESENNALM